MRTRPWLLSLLLAFLQRGVTAWLCDLADLSNVHSNTYLQASVLTAISDSGLSMCERKCSNATGSLSFNYFRSEGKCECLGENSTTSPHALVPREGWHHEDMNTAGKKNSSLSCLCPSGLPCHVDLPALLRCLQNCPPPPSLANADVTVTEVSQVSTASYTCLPNFRFFGSSSHVTCSDKETWVGLSGSCQQVTWYNMMVAPGKVTLPLPSPIVPGWKVEVVCRPTAAARAVIAFKDGTNNRLHMEMRLDYLAMRNVTFFKSDMQGVDTYGVNLNSTPWVVGTQYNVTLLVNSDFSAYQALWDGGFSITHPCPGNCGPVTGVLVAFETFVDSLRMVYP